MHWLAFLATCQPECSFKWNGQGQPMNGPIPEEIGSYIGITHLSFENNQLTGAIPSQIGNLSALTYLSFEGNQFTGTIPSQIGELTSMTYLWFKNNNFIGAIPSHIGKLTDMTYLSLENNQFTGTIPSQIGKLTGMTYISFGRNRFTGTVPSQIGNLMHVALLSFELNQFIGTIPSQIGKLTALQSLPFAPNSFQGSIPSELGLLTNCLNFDVHINLLTGIAPSEIGSLPLTVLALGKNRLIGTIPSEFGKLVALTYVVLHWNSFTGTIPIAMFSFPHMIWLMLSMNELKGSIPTEIGFANSLEKFSVGGNVHLSGSIPSEIGKLHHFESWDCRENQMIGAIPSEIGSLRKLEKILFEQNKLTGSIPVAIGGLMSLHTFGISWNRVIGTIPSQIGSLPSMDEFFVNNNQIVGTIPTEFGKLTRAALIDIFSNSLTGTIPCEISGLTSLTSLILSLNRLTGSIPDLGALDLMIELHVTSNQLSGTIPTQTGRIRSMIHVWMNGNRLTGTIPSEVGSLVEVTQLHVSFNKFTGNLPSTIGDLSSIEELHLDSNHLTGVVPSIIGKLARLQELHVQSNRLIGTLPSEIGGMLMLRDIDVSSNRFEGAFPDVGALLDLERLLMNRNHFDNISGEIIRAWKIDASENNMTEIPLALFNLPSASALNLSWNSLSRWTSRGVVPRQAICSYSLYHNRRTPVQWKALATLDVSGNEFGGSVRDFLYSLSHAPSLIYISARGCKMHGVVESDGFGMTVISGEGTDSCFRTEKDLTEDRSFLALSFLDLSHNLIEALRAPPVPSLSVALFNNNYLTWIHFDWWNWDDANSIGDFRVQGNPSLHLAVMAPRSCPQFPREFISNLGLFQPHSDGAFECTVHCRGNANVRMDVSVNIEMLCRCLKGYGGQGKSCHACGANEYENHDGLDYTTTECVPCPKHSTSQNKTLGSGIKHCMCKAGYYMDTKMSKCSECIAGRFTENEGAIECEQCEKGKWGNQSGATSCIQCSRGSFTSIVGASSCNPCEGGTYSSVEGGEACMSCEPGKFASPEGATSCSPCEPGRFANESARIACNSCMGGTYMNVQGGSECISCQAGNAAPESGVTSCMQCEKGYITSSTGKTSCDPCIKGMYSDVFGGTECIFCPPGTFSSQQEGSSLCSLCLEGRFGTENAQTACVSCGVGTFSNEQGGTECISCAPGKFAVPESVALGRFACLPCEIGTFASKSAMTKCSNCPEGRVASDSGMVECSKCQMGTFMPDTNASICKRCESGRFANDEGMTACVNCDPGMITVGLGAVSEIECVCPAGMLLTTASPHKECGPCPEGMTCEIGCIDWSLPARGAQHFPRLLPGYMTLADPHVVYRCLNTQSCPGGDSNSCGPNMENIACSICEKGYHRDGNLCVKCEAANALPFVAMVACIALIICAICFLVNRKILVKTKSSALFVALGSVVCSSLQTLAVFGTLDVTWLEPLRWTIDTISTFSLPVEHVNIDCMFGSAPLRHFTCRQLFGPFLAAFIFGFLVCKKCVRPLQTQLRVEMCNTCGFVGNVLFISLLISAVSPFVCYSHPGDAGASMVSAPSVLCFESEEHWMMVVVAFVGILAVLGPILAMNIYGVVRYPAWVSGEGSRSHLRAFQFLFFRFTPRRYYFAIIMLFRSTLICFVPVVIAGMPAIQICAMVEIIALFIVIHMLQRPWGDGMGNWIDGILNKMLILILVLALADAKINASQMSRQVMSIVVVVVLVISMVCAFAFTSRLHLVPSPYFGSFICHHKSAAAAQARYLQLMLQARTNQNVFIDSDHLQDLDELFDCVACKLGHLIVYLTRQTLSRPWCAGEIVTAFRTNGKVKVSAVHHSSFIAPSEADKRHLEKYLDMSSCNLGEYGIYFEDIADAFGSLLDEQRTPQLKLSNELMGSNRFELLICDLLGKACKHPTAISASKHPGMILVSSEPGNDEATAAAGILVHKMRKHSNRISDATIYCVGDSEPDASDLGKSVVSARAVVVLLSSGTLSSWIQIKVIVEAMFVAVSAQELSTSPSGALSKSVSNGCVQHHASTETSKPYENDNSWSSRLAVPPSLKAPVKESSKDNMIGVVVPVIAPGFVFPDAEFFEHRLYTVWRERPEEAEQLIRSFFKRIGTSLETWASDTVLEAQVRDVVARIPKKFDPSVVEKMKPLFNSSAPLEIPKESLHLPDIDEELQTGASNPGGVALEINSASDPGRMSFTHHQSVESVPGLLISSHTVGLESLTNVQMIKRALSIGDDDALEVAIGGSRDNLQKMIMSKAQSFNGHESEKALIDL